MELTSLPIFPVILLSWAYSVRSEYGIQSIYFRIDNQAIDWSIQDRGHLPYSIGQLQFA